MDNIKTCLHGGGGSFMGGGYMGGSIQLMDLSNILNFQQKEAPLEMSMNTYLVSVLEI